MRRLVEPKIVLASHNAGKLKEIRELLQPFGTKCISAQDLGLNEPKETEDSFAGNARIKAHFAAKQSGLPALSDDSGITVDGLDGAPGVYTADWAETKNGRDFAMAMRRVWDMLNDRGVTAPRLAQFRCTLCLAWPDGHDEVFEGISHGSLTWPMRGEFGFGFDPMFVPVGHQQTFAEMTPEERLPLTHRSDAFQKLVAGLF